MGEAHDLKLVTKVLNRHGFKAVRFTSKETRMGKTPDFKVYDAHSLKFFCEVKSIDPEPWNEGVRPDRIYDRIAQKIYESSKQFEAVNKDHNIANVLALVNHEGISDFTDLVLVVGGHTIENDINMWFVKPVIMKRLYKHAQHLPDMIIWFNINGSPQFMFFEMSHYYQFLRDSFHD